MHQRDIFQMKTTSDMSHICWDLLVWTLEKNMKQLLLKFHNTKKEFAFEFVTEAVKNLFYSYKYARM